MELEIKEVAIYLRKSRDETDGQEDVLAKHENLLVEYANKNNFKYTIYKEIGSSEYIDGRPEMIQLLQDVSNDFYDAVLVVDLDRLSRGDLEEIGKIRRVFKESGTLVVTPVRIYDFNNEEQEVMTDIEQVFARFEYKQIKKRFNRGKKQGAKVGKWVNGTPPFPYFYNREEKKLEIDEENLKLYNLMKKMFLEDSMPFYEIAWELNKLGFKTNRGSNWHENSISRLLKSEVHLGKIIYGKTSGSGHKKKKPNVKGVKIKNQDEWIVSEGTHHPVKTIEEHERILAICQQRQIQPKGTRNNIQVLSKLVLCGKCGKAMSFLIRSNGKIFIKNCQKADPYGNRCRNSGLDVQIVYNELWNRLLEYEKMLKSKESINSNNDTSLLTALKNKKSELIKLEKGIERIKEMFIEEVIEKNEMKIRTEKQQKLIQSKKEEIYAIEQSISINSLHTDEDRLIKISEFKNAWNVEEIEKEKLNKLAKEIIDRIEIIRNGDSINMDIKFL